LKPTFKKHLDAMKTVNSLAPEKTAVKMEREYSLICKKAKSWYVW